MISMPAALEFENVTKEYRSLWRDERHRALDGFSLAVRPGEIFGFLGPNGAGKSTAIHIALGLLRSSAGSGRLLGQRFGHAATRRRVGFLAENVSFYLRPAASLVRFYGGLNGIQDPQLARRTRELLHQLDLDDVSSKPISKFSRGMLQRVGLAQALVNDPELLVLDEPTSALDPAARAGVRELLLEARRNGKTIFLSSHLLSEIELLCDRIGILHRGKLVRLGTIDELLNVKDEFEIVARGLPPGFALAGADHGALSPAGATSSDGASVFVVPAASQRPAVERIWAAGGEIVRILPHRRSLEDLFLELTEPREPA